LVSQGLNEEYYIEYNSFEGFWSRGFRSMTVASLSVGDMSQSRGFNERGRDLLETGEWQPFVVGGVQCKASVRPVKSNVLVLVAIEEKDVFICFLGPREYWDAWRVTLEQATWKNQSDQRDLQKSGANP